MSSKSKPIVLTIAGTDPTCGAGVSADLEAINAIGSRGIFSITAITAQDEGAVFTIHPISADILSQQLASAVRLHNPSAIKVGMVATQANVRVISWFLDRYSNIPIIVDPILHSSSGYSLLEQEALKLYQRSILPRATIVTPNIPEAEFLAGQQIINVKTMEVAAKAIHDQILKSRDKISKPLSVIIKGGHLTGDEVVDILYDGQGWKYFSAHRIAGKSPRGTGCRFASSVAASLAMEDNLIVAVEKAREYLRNYIISNQ